MRTAPLFNLAIIAGFLVSACGNDNSALSGGTGGANTGGANTGGSQPTGGANTAGSQPTGGANTGGSQPTGGSVATGGADTCGANTGGANTGGANTGGANTGGGTGLGFTIRTPPSRTLTCTGGTHTFDDVDWICTFSHGGTQGFVYIQSTPVDCVNFGSILPTFSTAVAEISTNGQVEALQGAVYDWGGNHHNDTLFFAYKGNGYNYYHSSFGYGGRSCQNMDCLQVSVGGTSPASTVTDDGCTADRTLPIVCSKIKSDGTYDDLSVDNFDWCLGDPNYP